MAKITMIQRNPVTITADTSNISRFAQAGETIGRGIEQYQSQQDKIKKASIDMEVAKKNSELNLRLNNSFNSIKNKYQSDPLGGEEAFNSEIEMTISDVSKDMNEQSMNAFKAQTYKYADTYKMKANNWSATQNTANVFTNYDEADKSYNEQFYLAGKSLDQESFATAMASYTNNLNLYSSAIEPSKLKELNETSKSDFVKSYLTGAVRSDPVKASEMLNSGDYDNYLTVQDKDTLKQSMLNQALNNTNADIKLKAKQPYTWAATQGDPVAPIDLSNSQEMTNSIMDRQEYIDTRSLKYGTKMDFLTPEESKQFMQIANDPDIDSAVDFMTQLSINGNNSSENSIARQIAKEDVVAAAAFSTSGSNQQLAKDMLIGRQLLKDKSVAINYQDKDMVNTIRDEYGDSIQDPVILGQIVKASKAAYAANVYRGQSDNSDTYKDILKQSLGDSASVNGFKTPTFIKNDGSTMDGGTFEDLYENLTIEYLKESGQDNLAIPEQLDSYKKYGRLLPVGDGQYNIVMTTTNRFVADKTGKPFTLDMKTLYNANVTREMNKLRKFFK